MMMVQIGGSLGIHHAVESRRSAAKRIVVVGSTTTACRHGATKAASKNATFPGPTATAVIVVGILPNSVIYKFTRELGPYDIKYTSHVWYNERTGRKKNRNVYVRSCNENLTRERRKDECRVSMRKKFI